MARVCRKSRPKGSFQSWIAVPSPNWTPRWDRSVRIWQASVMLRAKRSNLVTVKMLPFQTAASAWSRPARFLRLVPENPQSM